MSCHWIKKSVALVWEDRTFYIILQLFFFVVVFVFALSISKLMKYL